jgi:isopentenyl-diphosphate Delta-isomerase
VSSNEVERRKAEHLRVVAKGEVESHAGPGWADVHLVHESLPRTDAERVDLSAEFLGRRLNAPLAIAAMTGGHAAGRSVNARLAGAARRHGLAMGLGSQRAAFRNPELAGTYRVARETAPDAFLIANIGAAQLVAQEREAPLSPEQVGELVAMVSADALAIHLNFLEEIVQPEGDRRVAGLRSALAAVVVSLPVPAIAKETGAGLSRPTAQELAAIGFKALDVGGRGGTSFAAVEAVRAGEQGDQRRQALGRLYREWGIPTAASVVAAASTGLPVIATGGVRSGLDAAKALALGASLVGVGRPLLVAALEGDEALDAWICQFLEELRAAVFLTGGARVSDLRSVPRVITGEMRPWLQAMEAQA